jgi:hypothetical protein
MPDEHVLPMMNEGELGPRIGEEIMDLHQRGAAVELSLTPVAAFTLMGYLQLAMRHPGAQERASKGVILAIMGHIRRFFAGSPAVLEVIRRGDDPAHDVDPRRI